MTRHRAPLLLLTGLVALALPTPGIGQSPGAAAPPAAYRPGLGDLMTATVQPRHIKLGLAGKEANWSYAAYELHELQEAFDRAARVWPRYRRTMPIADMIASTVTAPMAALDQAIKAGNATQFSAAYGQLTSACNACHQGTERPMIVIRQPEASPYPDQDFRPAAH